MFATSINLIYYTYNILYPCIYQVLPTKNFILLLFKYHIVSVVIFIPKKLLKSFHFNVLIISII